MHNYASKFDFSHLEFQARQSCQSGFGIVPDPIKENPSGPQVEHPVYFQVVSRRHWQVMAMWMESLQIALNEIIQGLIKKTMDELAFERLHTAHFCNHLSKLQQRWIQVIRSGLYIEAPAVLRHSVLGQHSAKDFLFRWRVDLIRIRQPHEAHTVIRNPYRTAAVRGNVQEYINHVAVLVKQRSNHLPYTRTLFRSKQKTAYE